jgi:hypothetical protein
MNLKRGACYSSTPQKIHRPSGQGIVIPITSKEKIKRSSAIEKNVLKDLSIEKKLIGDKQIPLHSYNYSYIKDRLHAVYDHHRPGQEKRILLKKTQRRLHNREVLTHYIGQLIQHDFSHHLRAPAAQQKWYLKVTYALSPQAKGKIERPYRWIQDRLVRTCVRENVADIGPARTLLSREIQRDNFHQVHSTTLEIPYLRFQRAMKLRQSLFREFKVKPPFQLVKDIFCLRPKRTADTCRRISLNNFTISYPWS